MAEPKVLFPVFSADELCRACGGAVSRETRVRRAASGLRGSVCGRCEAAPVTTFTEFSAYLAEPAWLRSAERPFVDRPMFDPRSPCA